MYYQRRAIMSVLKRYIYIHHFDSTEGLQHGGLLSYQPQHALKAGTPGITGTQVSSHTPSVCQQIAEEFGLATERNLSKMNENGIDISFGKQI